VAGRRTDFPKETKAPISCGNWRRKPAEGEGEKEPRNESYSGRCGENPETFDWAVNFYTILGREKKPQRGKGGKKAAGNSGDHLPEGGGSDSNRDCYYSEAGLKEKGNR